MRNRLLTMLDNLGNYARKVDDRYAEGVRNLVMDPGGTGNLATARNYAGAIMGAPLRVESVDYDPSRMNQFLKYAVPATSGAVRYGVPAVGLTVAGQGLSELINSIYEKDDER